MEMATARCLMRRARFSDCGSPSTKQLLSEPKASSDTRHTLGFKIHHTPPEKFLRAVGVFAVPVSGGCIPEAGTALAGM